MLARGTMNIEREGRVAYSLTREGGVGIITMQNPPANAYTKQTLLELQRCIDEARNDAAVRCVVIKSALDSRAAVSTQAVLTAASSVSTGLKAAGRHPGPPRGLTSGGAWR